MSVGEWLRSIGLGQYEAKFREHDIEVETLSNLSEDDLKRLGVALGARKRILRAAADLRSPIPSHGAGGAPVFAAAVARRPITVLFCDFEGSALAPEFDAEDWREFLGGYLEEATAAVRSFGGHLPRMLGDNLMAVFGYPQAEENDAERAVRTALAIQQAVEDLNAARPPNSLRLLPRIGLDSGEVVVDSIGGVFGSATSTAARVQAVAHPGAILITANVLRQVAGQFVAEDHGTQDLKGVPRPLRVYRVIRASGGRRLGSVGSLTPFVGREDELRLLIEGFERARSGEGRLTLVLGEPGVGKTRLLAEFRKQLVETPHTWVDWNASQLLQNTPFHPLAEWGRERFDIAKPSAERLAELERLLELAGFDPEDVVPLLAPLIDIPLPPGRASALPADQLRRRQLKALEAIALVGARTQPFILAFEDLQWSDPSSLEVLAALAKSGSKAAVYIVATARLEFHPPWPARAHHSVIALKPLDAANTKAMLDSLASGRSLKPDTIEGAIERSGGVPLFIEELTRLLLEPGEPNPRAIPPRLFQSLTARLDRLGAAREVAEVGAVLGREFPYALLREVTGLPEASLKAALGRLVEADILLVQGEPPGASCRFKHALIRDAAAEGLVTTHRQALHQRAAEVLRGLSEKGWTSEPEAIARHFMEAGLCEDAIEWWSKAGEHALERSAFQEAIAQFSKAIEVADGLDRNSADAASHGAFMRRRRALQSAYERAVTLSRAFATQE